MRQSGQFIEMNKDEFLHWLINLQVNRQITHIQIHHTWEPNYSSGNDSIGMSKGMKDYQVNEEGWADIGQHFSTVKTGLICTGRSLDRDPAGIMAHNGGGICIENIGNFDMGGDIMTPEHYQSIPFYVAALCYKFNLPINTDTVVYHNWFGYLSPANIKTCPGTNFYGGNTQQAAINNFYPLVAKELENIRSILNPPIVQPWMINVLNYLKDQKIILNDHDPFQKLDFQTFGFLINNMTDKLTGIDAIGYLTNKGIIKNPHLPNELITWQNLGYMIANRNGQVVSNPIQFLVDKGYIKSSKDPNSAVMFVEYGAIIMNARNNGLII